MSDQSARYKIVVTEIGVREGTIGKRWTTIGKNEQGQDVLGYTPETTSLVHYERQLLAQEIETLDLAAVIRAVNGL